MLNAKISGIASYVPDDVLDNDDTYYSSLTPEADVKDLEEEGLSIEDVSESDEDE